MHWTVNTQGIIDSISTSAIPVSAKLWEAVNESNRDFRLTSGINYYSTTLTTGKCNSTGCQYPIHINAPTKGWKASFVEMTFKQADGNDLVLTSPVYITNGRS